ncbi:MAG: hypothetical protein LIP10_12310, partial [Clostridiales bacterium]|nr:hypothetical protein [Clostridiales bacterium]
MLKETQNYINKGDMVSLWYLFSSALDVDPTFEKYREDYEKCKNLPDFFQPYRELTPLRENPAEWDENYWAHLKSDQKENFSEKRFLHMMEVAKVLKKEKIERLLKERKEEEERKQKEEAERKRREEAEQKHEEDRKRREEAEQKHEEDRKRREEA